MYEYVCTRRPLMGTAWQKKEKKKKQVNFAAPQANAHRKKISRSTPPHSDIIHNIFFDTLVLLNRLVKITFENSAPPAEVHKHSIQNLTNK